MADYTPVYTNGSIPQTYIAGAAITGGQLVFVSGVRTVTPTAGVNGLVVGIAAQDAASGANVAVWPLVGPMHETVAPAGVTAADPLTSSTAGGIATGVLATVAAAGTFLGIAVNTATAGNKARWTTR